MKIQKSLCFALLLSSFCWLPQWVNAQSDKRALDHADYDRWNSIGTSQISNDGNWILFSTRSAKKDSESTLIVRQTHSTKQYSIPRGASSRFTFDSKYLAYRVLPEKKRIEQLRKAGIKSDELPAGRLEILELKTGQRSTFDRVSSFSIPEKNGRWIAFIDQDGTDKKLATTNSKVSESLLVAEGELKEKPKSQKLKPRRKDPFAMPLARSGKEEPSKVKKASEAKKESKDQPKPEKKTKSIGKTLVIRNLETGMQQTFPNVSRFRFDKSGSRLAFATSVVDDTSKINKDKKKDTSDQPLDSVVVVELKSMKMTTILRGVGEFKSMQFNEQGDQLALLSNIDDYQVKTPSWSIYHWKSNAREATRVVAETFAGVPKGWWISPNSSLQFSEDNQRLFFSTAPIPENVNDERNSAAGAKEKEKKAKLDLWHWQDPRLQPQQLLQAESDRRRSYRAAFDIKAKKIVQLATKAVPTVSIDIRNPSEIAIASTDMPYRKMMSWDIPGFRDVYQINLKSGEQTKILEKQRAMASLSPEGKFAVWFDPEKKHWHSMAIGTKEPIEISTDIQESLADELHDTPSLPRSYGSAGWLKDDLGLLVYDRFDIWQLDPTGKQPAKRLTEGRENKIRFRAMRLDREQRSIDPAQPIFLTAFDEGTKASGFYQLNLQDLVDVVGKTSSEKKKETKPDQPGSSEVKKGNHQLVMVDASLGRLIKARESRQVMFTRSTFRDYPDLWTSTLDFKKFDRISDVNPQQKEFLWGDAELVNWKAKDGQELQGLLYKPEGFDPSKKYPMMVYFYERYSDRLHTYYPPAAGRSIINFSFYVSRGYVVFVPDIPYKTGEPGPSAANAILPGVEHMIAQGYIDSDKVGMQGHSWGGYQTAYLVTQTDMFACAESGAPVSNMTSAYGGIRWGSGMSRMFQYERTQSRIGGDLWSARDKYIMNSPVFFADKVNTPLLILHNDEDGAVPWYQGIELFVALRRLGKPAWMLNYNGEPHWVMDDANRLDFAKRMQQFFDHYLKDAPEPEWMAYGIPAVVKGKEFGFDLLEPKQEKPSKPKSKTEELP